jgi:hypothetical protein
VIKGSWVAWRVTLAVPTLKADLAIKGKHHLEDLSKKDETKADVAGIWTTREGPPPNDRPMHGFLN